MNYRQTRHENVILFMGACMVPPHLAIITRCGRRSPASPARAGVDVPELCFLLSFCKGLTLYSMVRKRAHVLDLNKTRQIAQDVVNVRNHRPFAVTFDPEAALPDQSALVTGSVVWLRWLTQRRAN